MARRVIATAEVDVVSDVSDAERAMRDLNTAFNRVEKQAEQAGESIEGSMREAATTAGNQLNKIGGADAFNQAGSAAQRAGEDIEDAFREAGRTSDQALEKIGGADVFGDIGSPGTARPERKSRTRSTRRSANPTTTSARSARRASAG